MPPEQLNGSLSFKTDIWGFGCLLLQFATGLKPFHDVDNELAASIKVFQGINPLDYALKNADAEALELLHQYDDFKDIITKCLTIEYKDRPSADELFHEPFFEGNTC